MFPFYCLGKAIEMFPVELFKGRVPDRTIPLKLFQELTQQGECMDESLPVMQSYPFCCLMRFNADPALNQPIWFSLSVWFTGKVSMVPS